MNILDKNSEKKLFPARHPYKKHLLNIWKKHFFRFFFIIPATKNVCTLQTKTYKKRNTSFEVLFCAPLPLYMYTDAYDIAIGGDWFLDKV